MKRISSPDIITVEFTTSDVKCKNGSDGSVNVITISGGNGDYTYQW